MPNKYLDSVQLGRLITKIKSLVSTTAAGYLPLTGGTITGKTKQIVVNFTDGVDVRILHFHGGV